MDAEETRLYYLLWLAGILLTIIVLIFIAVMVRNHLHILKAIRGQLDIQVKFADEIRSQVVEGLHDDISPLVSTMGLKLEFMEQHPEMSHGLVKEAVLINEDIMKETRRLSKLMLPYYVSSNSLPAAIDNFLKRLPTETLQVNIVCDDIPLLQQHYLVAICRLLQEIVHNTIKHSSAGKLKMDIRYKNNQLIIRTAEEGWKKLVKEKKYVQPDIGKELMESRIRLLKGTINSNTSKSEGTRYYICIPLPSKIRLHERGN